MLVENFIQKKEMQQLSFSMKTELQRQDEFAKLLLERENTKSSCAGTIASL
jgi:hypothetical protein